MIRAKLDSAIQKYVLKKEWDKAIELYREILDQGGETGDVYNRLGDMYMKKGDKKSAVDNYLRAIDLYIKDELYENGTAICSKMLRYGIDRSDLYFRLAQLNAKLNLGFEAIKWFNMYLKKDSEISCIEKYINEYEEMLTLLSGHDLLLDKVKNIYLKVDVRVEALDKLFRIKKGGLTEEDVEFLSTTIQSIKDYMEKGYKRDVKEEIEVYRNLKLNKQAIGVVQKELRDTPDDLEKMKLLGLCFLEDHKPRLALRIFRYMIEKKRLSEEMKEEIKGYVALARARMKYVTT